MNTLNVNGLKDLSFEESKNLDGGVLLFVYAFGLGVAYGFVTEKFDSGEW